MGRRPVSGCEPAVFLPLQHTRQFALGITLDNAACEIIIKPVGFGHFHSFFCPSWKVKPTWSCCFNVSLTRNSLSRHEKYWPSQLVLQINQLEPLYLVARCLWPDARLPRDYFSPDNDCLKGDCENADLFNWRSTLRL